MSRWILISHDPEEQLEDLAYAPISVFGSSDLAGPTDDEISNAADRVILRHGGDCSDSRSFYQFTLVCLDDSKEIQVTVPRKLSVNRLG